MSREKLTERFSKMKEAAFSGGGAERVEKQHREGKLTARERIKLLFDGGIFQELGMFVESRSVDFGMDKKRYLGDGVITGYGKVNGRLTFAISQDFTVLGGAGGEEYVLKMCRLIEMAIEAQAPIITLNDSGGARIQEGVCALAAYSKLFYLNTAASGLIPQIAVIMGNCAGGASYSPILCDFIFMVEGTSQMYITGPKVIKAATGKDVSMDELGGSSIHSRISGQSHFTYPNDEQCIQAVRNFLTYLPQSCNGAVPDGLVDLQPDVSVDINSILPDSSKRGYDVRQVINAIFDKDSFIEIQEEFAPNAVVGLARMKGQSVGVVANQPSVMSGALDCNASDKVARFIRFCDCFNIPIVTLVDVPGFCPGIEQEYNGIIRHGGKLLFAYSEATVPRISLILRKAYGGAYCAMNSKNMGADIVYAWPTAEIAVMGAVGALNMIFRTKISNATDPELERSRLIEEYEEAYANPFVAAKRGYVDEIITPIESRHKIIAALDMLRNKKQQKPLKKHGNIPL